jgi:flagellar biosynthesis/type III secretory pathway M-ring protein FliF/YscJ
MRTYTKPNFMDRLKLAVIWIVVLSVVWLISTSCARQKQLMENYQRDKEYLSYRGKRPANQDMKEGQVLRAREIRISQRKAARKKQIAKN